MPDFIVIDEVNNKVNQSESNTVTHVLASNTAILSAVNSMNNRINNLYNTTNELKQASFKNASNGSAVVVYSTTGWVNVVASDERFTVAAKFIPPVTGVYYLTGNYYTSCIANSHAYPRFLAHYRRVDREDIDSETITSSVGGYSNYRRYQLTTRGLLKEYENLTIGTEISSVVNSPNYISAISCANIQSWAKSNVANTNGIGINCPIWCAKDEPFILFLATERVTANVKNLKITYYK